MPYVIALPRRGFGQVTGAQQTASRVGQVGSLATPAVTGTLSATSTAAGATILGLAPAVAIPLIGAALAGVTFAVTKLIANSGCGPTCIKSSDYANQAGDLMTKNMNAYLALPAPRARTAQAVALQNFDSLWAQLVNLCTNDPELANTTAGRNCVADRQEGACKWRAAAGGWNQNSNGTWGYKPWGPAGSGGDCWNYFVGLRDPIANDPQVVDDSQTPAGAAAGSGAGAPATVGGAPGSAGSAVASVAALASTLPAWVWLLGGVGVYWLFFSGSGRGSHGRR